MNRITVLLLMVGFLSLSYPSSPADSPQKGILVHPQEAIHTEKDVDALVNYCDEYRITYIFLMIKQDTGPDSGLVYYNSPRIPRKSEFDILSRTIEKAHRKNIKVYVWIPLLYDKRLTEQNMGIKDYWISPLRSEESYINLVREVRAYDPDGILFDYLWFPDDFAASEQLKTDFGQKFGYNMGSVDLSLEKERNTPLWYQWISYRNDVLSTFLQNIMPEDLPVGVTAVPEELQDSDSEFVPPALVTFVAVQTHEDPTLLINRLTLLTKAGVYVIIPNDFVSEVRQRISESTYADMLLFDSDIWDENDFQRIKKAENPFADIRLTKITFIEYFNQQADMEKWESYQVNTAVLPAGHVFSTYFKFEPYPEKWSHYIQKYNTDYVEEMIVSARRANLYAVLQLNMQSEEYVTRYKEAASVTYQWGVNRKRICLTELNTEPYRSEFFEMAKFLADNYDAEALLVVNIAYLEDCFCTDCLKSYVDFMAEKGIPAEDWPRTDGVINVYDSTVREWKNAQIQLFLQDLRNYLRGSNKELWIEVPVSSNLEYASSEYGLYLPDLEDIVDRIVLTNIDLENPPRLEYIAKSLPTPSMYVIAFHVESSAPPVRTYLEDSLRIAFENGIISVGAYPQSVVTDTLWAAFYKGYAYRLALTNGDLMEIYTLGDYPNVIYTYSALEEERREIERQSRERARQSINEARRSYTQIPSKLEEARKLDVSVVTIETEIQQNLTLLAEAKNLFIEGEYQEAEEKGKKAIIEFSTLNARIGSLVEKERVKRLTSGALTLVVFLMIMMYVRFTMRKHKK